MKRRHSLLFLFLLLALGSSLSAQSLRDSLRQAYPQEKGAARYEAMLRLAEGYLRDSASMAADLCQQVVREATAEEFVSFRIMGYDLMGRAFVVQGQNTLAADQFQRGLTLSETHQVSRFRGHLINSMGVLYMQIGRYEDALAYLIEAKSYWEEEQDHLRATYTLLNLGNLLVNLERFAQAEKVLQDCQAEARRLGIGQLVVLSLNSLGNIQENLSQPGQALDYYQQAYAYYQDAKLHPSVAISTLGNIHNMLMRQGKDPQAKQYYLKALDLAKDYNQDPVLQRLLRQRADAFFNRQNFEQAIDLYLESLQLAERMGQTKEAEEIYLQLTQCFKQAEQPAQALFYHEQFTDMRQQRYEEVSSARIQELQTRFELDQMEEELVEMRRERDQRKIQNLILLLVIAAIAVALIALYSRYRLGRRTGQALAERAQEIEQQHEMLSRKTKEIIRKNQQLESKTEQIKSKNQQLKVSNEELEQMAYAVSHDLREPLRTIISYHQLLMRRNRDQLNEEGQEFLQFATDGAQRLHTMLNDLLTYSRIGRLNKEPEVVDLNELLQDLKRSLTPHLEQNDGRLDLQLMPMVHGRATEISLLFQNLILNGLKFAASDRKPHIKIDYAREGEMYHFRVADNGIGIPAHQNERIFQIFQRFHSHEEVEGSGIGLALCRKIVQNHGGKIWFTSQEGVGATFHIRLPATGGYRRVLE